MALAMLKSGLFALAAATFVIAPMGAQAQDGGTWRSGISTVGELKHPNGFERFDYVNPKAPKGGTLRLSTAGTFDTVNPLLAKGEVATGLGVVFDTLMKSSEEELSSSYGLLAEAVSFPDDISKLKTTSSAVTGWPSAHFASFRSR